MRMFPGIHTIHLVASVALLAAVMVASDAAAEQAQPGRQEASKPAPAPPTPPPDYVIGPGDVLTISIYGQDAHSGDVVVRPDGKISRLLIDEVQAAGLTPLELKNVLTKAYSTFFDQPMILVKPKQINSRKVGIAGLVNKPGEYLLNEPMDILQLITKAGGLQSYANKDNIRLIRRHPDGRIETIAFDYKKVFEGKGVTQIPQLRPGDQVIVR